MVSLTPHIFCLAWATGRFDLKALWAEKGDKKGNEKGCEHGESKMEERGYQKGHKDVDLYCRFRVKTYLSGRSGRLGALTSTPCGQKMETNGDAKRETKRDTERETKRETKRRNGIRKGRPKERRKGTRHNCRFELKACFKNRYFGPA